MGIFKKYNRKHFFRKIVKNQNINKSFKRINDSRIIGLIIDRDDEAVLEESNKFVEFLQKRKITVKKIFLSLEKVSKNNPEKEDTVYVIVKKFVNKTTLNNFCNIEYDILISAYCKEIYEYHYIGSITPAKLKVSPHYKEINYADLTFIIKENRIDNYFSAIKNYLIEKVNN